MYLAYIYQNVMISCENIKVNLSDVFTHCMLQSQLLMKCEHHDRFQQTIKYACQPELEA